jgi:co-chaperonin GroES (HSP10)
MDLGNLGVLDSVKTNETVTHADIPDPDVLPRVAGDFMLVRPISTKIGKIGSILLADDTQDDIKYLNNVGRILAFGPRCFKTKDDKVIEWVEGGLKLGDIVQWERFVGKRLRYKGVNLVLLKDVAIQMVLEDAHDVDPNVNIET